MASPKVSRFAAMHDFEGAEFLAGIPGTVGGALAMNAGCYGAETWDIVEQVLTLNRTGELIERTPGEYLIGYRHCERDAGTHRASRRMPRNGSPPPGSASRAATAKPRGRRSRTCCRGASPASRSTCPMPVRCSAIHRATMRRG